MKPGRIVLPFLSLAFLIAAPHGARTARAQNSAATSTEAAATIAEATAEPTGPHITLDEDFSQGASVWEPTVETSWDVKEIDGNSVYSQHTHSTAYQPPHRSPHNISLLKGVTVGDFELTVRAKTTARSYDHRSMCVFFGYQDPSHFYYVHFGQKTDDHANQIFIVNEADRIKISTKTTEGTPWDDQWHTIRIVRKVDSGEISVYFDDMENPMMTAEDKTFTWGRIGLGAFDDTGDWDDLHLDATLAAGEE